MMLISDSDRPEPASLLLFRPGGISVHYSLVFEINPSKINSENSETAPGSAESSTDSVLRDMVAAALREEASLPIDLDSLNFSPGTVSAPLLLLPLNVKRSVEYKVNVFLQEPSCSRR